MKVTRLFLMLSDQELAKLSAAHTEILAELESEIYEFRQGLLRLDQELTHER
jgi:hypothetical protein